MLATLLFAAGHRPDATAVVAFCAGGPLAVSHCPEPRHGELAPGWLELVATGLTFDLSGLAPGPAAARVGFVAGRSEETEPLTLALGPHLAGAGELPAVQRAAADVALALGGLPGVVAIGWHPAGVLLTPEDFAAAVELWLPAEAVPPA